MPMIRILGKKWNFASDDLLIITTLESMLRMFNLIVYVILSLMMTTAAPEIDGNRPRNVGYHSIIAAVFILNQFIILFLLILSAMFSLRGGVLECQKRTYAEHVFTYRLILSIAQISITITFFVIYSRMKSSSSASSKSSVPLIIALIIDTIILALLFAFLIIAFDPSSWSPQSKRLHSNALASVYGAYNLVVSDVIAGLLLLSGLDRSRQDLLPNDRSDFSDFEIANILYYYKHSLAVYSWPMMMYLSGPSSTFENAQVLLKTLASRKYDKSQQVRLLDINAFKELVPCAQCDILHFDLSNSVFRAPFSLSADHEFRSLVLAIRGTMSVSDILTDLSVESHSFVFENIEGHCHHGMHETAMTIFKELKKGLLQKAITKYPEYQFVICGHSLGAGAAVILTMMLRSSELKIEAKCYAFAAPKSISANLADACRDFVISIVLADDIVSRLSVDSIKLLHERLVDALSDCPRPKYRIFLDFFRLGTFHSEDGCGGTYERLSEAAENRTNAYPTSISIEVPLNDRVHLPGIIFHICREQANESNKFIAKRRDREYFNEIYVRPYMLSDHLPATLLKALTSCASIPMRHQNYNPYHQHHRGIPQKQLEKLARYTIIDVWRNNLYESFIKIRELARTYNFVAMDTEFPGVVARPLGHFLSMAEYHYQALKVNVDILKVIQLGLSFFDEKGRADPDYTTFQFHFKFRREADMSAADSMKLLDQAGINFEKQEIDGIEPFEFAELMISSGVVLLENVTFLSFHSGYDFGYLLKVLTNRSLPDTEREFFEMLIFKLKTLSELLSYDVKYLMRSCKNLKGGLEEIAKQLDIPRIGPSHQAGSDSLLTGQVFFKIREMFFEDHIDEVKYSGHLFGLGICSIYAPQASSDLFTVNSSQMALPLPLPPINQYDNPISTVHQNANPNSQQYISGINFIGGQYPNGRMDYVLSQPTNDSFIPPPEMDRNVMYEPRLTRRQPQPIPIVSGVTGEQVIFPNYINYDRQHNISEAIADRSNQQQRSEMCQAENVELMENENETN
ncbi:hypothetical protein ACOME3_006845 [Neoechinorhynchus agilis]